MNTFAVGARVVLEADGQVWTRTVTAGGTNYGSSGPPELHFGLGERPRVERMTIHWPNGRDDVFDDVETRQTLTVRQRGAAHW